MLLKDLQACRQQASNAEAKNLTQTNELQIQLLTAHKLLIAWRLQHPLHSNFKQDNRITENTITKLQRGVQPLLQSWQQQELQQLRKLGKSSSQDFDVDDDLHQDDENLHDEQSADKILRNDLEADLLRLGEQLVEAQETIQALRHENCALQSKQRTSVPDKAQRASTPLHGTLYRPPRTDSVAEGGAASAEEATPVRRIEPKEDPQKRATPKRAASQRQTGWNDNTHVERREKPNTPAARGWNDNTHVQKKNLDETLRPAPRTRLAQRHKRLLGK
jgi:hypothetical protein